MDRGLNDVKWREAHSHIVHRNKTGHGNVYIFHLCGTPLLISWPVLKLTWITITLHKRICICCLSCRVEMGLCVCTQWAVMRSAAVQLAKWNPNKRSHFTLTAAESSRWLLAGQRKGLAQAQKSGFLESTHTLSEPLTFTDTHPHALPYNITLPHTMPAEQIPKQR